MWNTPHIIKTSWFAYHRQTLSVTQFHNSSDNFPHMACCCQLGPGCRVLVRHSWRGQVGTSCRRSGDTAGVWAPCCESSTCRQDTYPWARMWLVSVSLLPLVNFLPRFPRWWQCRRFQQFRHFRPLSQSLQLHELFNQLINTLSVTVENKEQLLISLT